MCQFGTLLPLYSRFLDRAGLRSELSPSPRADIRVLRACRVARVRPGLAWRASTSDPAPPDAPERVSGPTRGILAARPPKHSGDAMFQATFAVPASDVTGPSRHLLIVVLVNCVGPFSATAKALV
jgi:hypothetical protein